MEAEATTLDAMDKMDSRIKGTQTQTDSNVDDYCSTCITNGQAVYLSIDIFIERNTISISDKKHRISEPIFRLLCVFNYYENMPVSRECLLSCGWGTNNKTQNNVTVAVSDLRVLLRGTALQIVTIRGQGYQMRSSEEKLTITYRELSVQNNQKDKEALELVTAYQELMTESKLKEEYAKKLGIVHIGKVPESKALAIAYIKLKIESNLKDELAKELVMVNARKAKRTNDLVNARFEDQRLSQKVTLDHQERRQRQNELTLTTKHQAELAYITYFDRLTELPNRPLFFFQLAQAIVQCEIHNESLALITLDLDDFKAVNELYGHHVGDELLIALSTRMKDALRESDTLARIGGDEFGIIFTGLYNDKDCKTLLERLLTVASEPFIVHDIVIKVSASIGASLHPQDSISAEQLMRQADQAMYRSKQVGKNRYYILDNTQDNLVTEKLKSLVAIRNALNKHQFVLHYQPKVNMRTGLVIGFEALIRWQHPKRGLLSPVQFLPAIEHHSLQIDLGEWVIDTALTQISQWQKLGHKLPVGISVNIAALQLEQPNFTNRLTALLAAHPDVTPSCLELEILEKRALDDVQRVAQTMTACIALGVTFALDDFGTGYSSLTYLRQLPASVIKIDQSFVRDMLIDSGDLAIIHGVIALAKSFNRTVIAEGVETHQHGVALLQAGCDLAQGYGIAKPMPASDIPAWVSTWKPSEAWKV
jgi:diguanylate cyclase (GGDEF)-like protein